MRQKSREIKKTRGTRNYLVLPVKGEDPVEILSYLCKWRGIVSAAYVVVPEKEYSDCVQAMAELPAAPMPIFILEEINPGLAWAYATGIQEAMDVMGPKDYVITVDCGTWNPEEIEPHLMIGASALMGYRVRSNRLLYKSVVSWVGKKCIKLFSSVRYIDPTCGFRAYRGDLLEWMLYSPTPPVPNRVYHAYLAAEVLAIFESIPGTSVIEFPCTHRVTNSAMKFSDVVDSAIWVIKGGLKCSLVV